MPKRYVFWRTPDGRVSRKPTGDDTSRKHAPRELLSALGMAAKLNEKGQVTWTGFSFLQDEVALRSAIVVLDSNNRELNGEDSWSIIRAAISTLIKKAGGETAIDPDALLKESDKVAGKFLRKPAEDYFLVTNLAVKEFPKKNIRISGCDISMVRSGRRRYPLPRIVKYQSPGIRFTEHIENTQYLVVRVKASGRSIYEAEEQARNALTLLRGYWNLLSTFGQWSFGFGGSRVKPIGVIHVGAFHTLHTSDGKPNGDIFWYDPDYIEDHDLFVPKKGWDKIEKERQWAMAKVRQLEYRSDIEDLIRRYAIALDQSNLDIAFLQIWAILEKITDTVGARYDETIKRTVWAFSDREVAKEYLNGLRFRRNQFVHSGKSSSDRQQIAYLVKSFVDPHLLRLIRNDFGVTTLQEYGSHLSLPVDIAAIRKRERQLKVARSILERNQKTAEPDD